LQYNQQQLIAGAVVFVLLLVGTSLWKEREKSQKEAAALMYIEAVNKTNTDEKNALLDSVIKTYPDSGYAILAHLQQASSGNLEKRKAALQALLDNQGAPEFVWQARLDLAALYLAEKDMEKAKSLLEERVGKHYEQARYALLARTTNDKAEKIEMLEKALDAESHDTNLQASLEAELAQLKASE
jgi:predicted negative regulator of RcsB-dependent stress response